MATHVVNNAAERDVERSGTGWIVAIIALLALVLLFLFAGVFFSDNAPAAVPDAVTPGAAGSIDIDAGGSMTPGTGGTPAQ